MKSKDEMRTEALRRRARLGEEAKAVNSRCIVDSLLATSCFRRSRRVMAYSDFRNEVRTRYLLEAVLARHKTLFLPRVNPDKREMEAVRVGDLDRDLEVGNYGILEPTGSDEIHPGELQLIIVPGVAWDKEGYRVGYGGGYYDRFLDESNRDPVTVGFAYECQLFEQVPRQPHDKKVDILLTEERAVFLSA